MTSEEYHDKLATLIGEVVTKAISFTGNGLSWEDAEKFLKLNRQSLTISLGSGSDIDGEFAVDCDVATCDEPDKTFASHRVPLSEIVLFQAEYMGDFVAECRDGLARSLAKIDAWLAENSA